MKALDLTTYYQKTLDGVLGDISTGAFDYNTGLRKTVKEMTNSGLRWIDYDSGWHNRVTVAARRAVMTGFNQTMSHMNEKTARDLGTIHFEVTWHAGARPTHQVWQGRVYTKRQLVDICGLGSGAGLKGWNCYHDYLPFVPGASVRTYSDEQLDRLNAAENEPKVYNGKEYTTYEALQRQRQLETNMRAQRQEIDLLKKGGADKNDIMNAQAKYHVTSGEYTALSKSMGLPQQRERVLIGGLSKSTQVSGAVSGALNPNSKEAAKFAQTYYEQIRKMNTDVMRISQNTGITVEKVASIKKYLFLEKHDLGDGRIEFFDSDYDIAQSWKRLSEGSKLEPQDILLLEHELAEIDFVKQGLSQKESHKRANLMYNYSKALEGGRKQ